MGLQRDVDWVCKFPKGKEKEQVSERGNLWEDLKECQRERVKVLYLGRSMRTE